MTNSWRVLLLRWRHCQSPCWPSSLVQYSHAQKVATDTELKALQDKEKKRYIVDPPLCVMCMHAQRSAHYLQ